MTNTPTLTVVYTDESPDLDQYINFKLEEFLKWMQEEAAPARKDVPNNGGNKKRSEECWADIKISSFLEVNEREVIRHARKNTKCAHGVDITSYQ